MRFLLERQVQWQEWVLFGVVFALPWVIGEALILLCAIRFVSRVWGWLT